MSKSLALGVQLFALPLALHALGTNRYTSFLALQAFLSWTGLSGFGLSVSLPKFVAAAHVGGKQSDERNVVVSAITFMGVTSTAVLVVLTLAGVFFRPGTLIAAAPSISPAELSAAYFVAVAINVLQIFTSIDSSIRSGYQEFHRVSICATLASVCVLAGLGYVSTHAVTIAWFIAVLYLPQVVMFAGDMALLFFRRSYLYRGSVAFMTTIKAIAKPSGNALAYQAQFALVMYLPTLIVAHLTSPGATAVFGSVLQLLTLGISALNLIFQPMISAVVNAHSLNDVEWIKRNYKRVLYFVVAVGLAVVLIFAVGGPFLLKLWLGSSVSMSHELGFYFGMCFLFMALTQYQFFMISAMGALNGTAIISLTQGVGALAIGTGLCAVSGVVGMVQGLALCLAVAALWLFYRVQREIRRMDASSVDGPGADGVVKA